VNANTVRTPTTDNNILFITYKIPKQKHSITLFKTKA